MFSFHLFLISFKTLSFEKFNLEHVFVKLDYISLFFLMYPPGPAFQLIGLRISDKHKRQPIGYHDETRLGGGLPGIGNDDFRVGHRDPW